MKYLLPLLCCAAVFFGGRQFRIMRAAAAPVSPGEAAAAKSRGGLRGLAGQAERLAGHDCPSAAALKRLFRSGALSNDELKRAIRQAAEQDPAGTWQWIADGDFHDNAEFALRQTVLAQWFARDPAKALAALSATASPQASKLANGLIGQLGGADHPLSEAVRLHLPGLVSLLGGMESEIAPPARTAANAELLLSLADAYSRDLLLGNFAVAWLGEDPVAAAAFLKRLPEGLRIQSLEEFAEGALGARKMPDSEGARKFAIDWLLKEASAGARARLGPRLARAMAEDDPAAALKWAGANLDGKVLADTTAGIFEQVVAGDPQRARALVESLPAGSRRELAASKVAEGWVAKDAAAAITWWLDHAQADAGGRREPSSSVAVVGLGRTWYEKNPDSFRAWLADPDAPKLPENLMQAGLQGMMKDREATFEWIGSLPPAHRGPVVKLAYQHLASQSPEEAAGAFEARPDLATGDSARIIATLWYGRDPKKAIGWVSNLPWGGTREAALAGLRKMAETQVQRGGSIPEELRELLHVGNKITND